MLYVLVPKEMPAKHSRKKSETRLAGRTGCGTSKWWKLLTPSSWALDSESWVLGSCGANCCSCFAFAFI